ncbi:MAG TPA: serine/threonine protein kinase [Thermoanaerobaculia bacterium]
MFGRPLPLIVRVSLALALVAVLPLGYAVWSLFDVNRAGMHEQVLRTHAVAASTAAERIATTIETRRAFARSLALNASITADPRSDVAKGLLQEILGSDPSIGMIDVITPANEVVIRAQRRGIAERAGALPLTSEPRIWASGGTQWLLVSEPFGTGGTLRLLGEVPTIADALDPAEVGDEAEMVLASPAGVVAGRGSLATFPRPMIEAARTARVNGTGVYPDGKGNDIMGAFAPVAGTNWFVLSRQPFARANEISAKMQRRAATAAVVALVLAIVVALIAQRTIVKPIRAVIRAQQRLAGTPIPSGSEIEQLRASAEKIERRIADQEDLGRVFLGRYQVTGIIGQGGMGTVFRGWDPKLRRPVALKTVRFDTVAPEEARELVDTLVVEAVTAASVNHPNIVSVFDVEDTPQAAFIAMELVDGMSAQSFLDLYGKMSPEQTVLVGAAVARALDAAHTRGFQHHDVKPANVLLGYDGAIKVADFGLAAMIMNMSKSQEVVFGTPGYIAPEVATATGRDARSDLFSLGVLLYQCATGENPFERDGARETILAAIMTTPPPLAEAVEGDREIVEPLARLVTALMQKHPDDRPSATSEVANGLELLARKHNLEWKLESVTGAIPPKGHGSAALIPTISLERLSR